MAEQPTLFSARLSLVTGDFQDGWCAKCCEHCFVKVSHGRKPVWHVISSDGLLAMLRRVAGGEDPEIVYLEEYVNADREDVDA